MLIILLATAFFIGLGLFLIANRPERFIVRRSLLIEAEPGALYDRVANFRNWTHWSPYEKLDADLIRTYGSAEAGLGASYGYAGNSKVGEGRMEIIRADAPRQLVMRLEFLRPFKAVNIAEFLFEPTPDGTRVSWIMSGPKPFIGKLLGPLFNMDKLVGAQFEEGLANLKTISEGQE